MLKFSAAMMFVFVTQAFAETPIGLSGFINVTDNAEFRKIKFHDEQTFILSKKKFNSQKDAEAFCKKEKMVLDTQSSPILIAMSGATLEDKFLHDAISYEFTIEGEKTSGVWYWGGIEDKIVLVADGRGMSSETITPAMFEEVLKKKPEIPAICVDPVEIAALKAKEAMRLINERKGYKEVPIDDSSRSSHKVVPAAEKTSGKAAKAKAK